MGTIGLEMAMVFLHKLNLRSNPENKRTPVQRALWFRMPHFALACEKGKVIEVLLVVLKLMMKIFNKGRFA